MMTKYSKLICCLYVGAKSGSASDAMLSRGGRGCAVKAPPGLGALFAGGGGRGTQRGRGGRK